MFKPRISERFERRWVTFPDNERIEAHPGEAGSKKLNLDIYLYPALHDVFVVPTIYDSFGSILLYRDFPYGFEYRLFASDMIGLGKFASDEHIKLWSFFYYASRPIQSDGKTVRSSVRRNTVLTMLARDRDSQSEDFKPLVRGPFDPGLPPNYVLPIVRSALEKVFLDKASMLKLDIEPEVSFIALRKSTQFGQFLMNLEKFTKQYPVMVEDLQDNVLKVRGTLTVIVTDGVDPASRITVDFSTTSYEFVKWEFDESATKIVGFEPITSFDDLPDWIDIEKIVAEHKELASFLTVEVGSDMWKCLRGAIGRSYAKFVDRLFQCESVQKIVSVATPKIDTPTENPLESAKVFNSETPATAPSTQSPPPSQPSADQVDEILDDLIDEMPAEPASGIDVEEFDEDLLL